MLDGLIRPGAVRLAVIIVCSILLSTGLVGLTRAMARRLRFTDYPNANTKNNGGAALGGGVGIVISILLMLWLFPAQTDTQSRIAFMMAALCALGLLDDIFRLTPLVKVLGQVACAAIYVMGTHFDIAAAAVVILFLMATSNAWNVVDVMDALLASIGSVAMLGGCAVMLLHGLAPQGLPTIPAIASGVLIGFLIWNRPPARIIMGDAGSLPLGMLFGVLVVESLTRSASLSVNVVLPGLIPFLEVGFLLVQRSRRRIPFYRSTPDHFALRLLHNGYTVAQIVTPVVLSGIGLTVFASLLELTSFHIIPTIVVSALLAIAIAWAYRFLVQLRVGGTIQARRTK